MKLYSIPLGGRDRTNGETFTASGAGVRVVQVIGAGVPIYISATGAAGERVRVRMGDVVWTPMGQLVVYHGAIPAGRGALVLASLSSAEWMEGVGTDADGAPFHTSRPGVASQDFPASAGNYNFLGVVCPNDGNMRAVVVRRVRAQNNSAAAAKLWLYRWDNSPTAGVGPRALDLSRPTDTTACRTKMISLQQNVIPPNAVYLDGMSLAAGETGWWDVPITVVPGTSLVLVSQVVNIATSGAMFFDEYSDS